jgi:DNA-binding LacI/PurR family transcriptional regulator
MAMFIRRVRSAKKAARTNLKRKVTLKTIADHLGLTPGTVSAALNNSAAARSILEHTKQRIRISARELNYRPNVSARILRLKKVGITHFRVVFSSFFSL